MLSGGIGNQEISLYKLLFMIDACIKFEYYCLPITSPSAKLGALCTGYEYDLYYCIHFKFSINILIKIGAFPLCFYQTWSRFLCILLIFQLGLIISGSIKGHRSSI